VSRVRALARRLDAMDPQWVVEIDLSDADPVLEQLFLGWLEVDHTDTLEALSLAAAEAEVFAPWGEAQWRMAVQERQQEDAVGRVVRAWLPIGHFLHPDDPDRRTSLCGQHILGIDATGTEQAVCTACLACAASGDWKPL
jgi:hypothetical protein